MDHHPGPWWRNRAGLSEAHCAERIGKNLHRRRFFKCVHSHCCVGKWCLWHHSTRKEDMAGIKMECQWIKYRGDWWPTAESHLIVRDCICGWACIPKKMIFVFSRVKGMVSNTGGIFLQPLIKRGRMVGTEWQPGSVLSACVHCLVKDVLRGCLQN